jgi:hypothetical protein
MNGVAEDADTAADRVIEICSNRQWTKVTDLDEFLSILDSYVRNSRGECSPFIYYRLLQAMGKPIPRITVKEAKRRDILDLEYELATTSCSQNEYEHKKIILYRYLRRSRSFDAMPDILAVELAKRNIAKTTSAHNLWQDSSLKHPFEGPDALLWLV